jgi:hypothetical protein
LYGKCISWCVTFSGLDNVDPVGISGFRKSLSNEELLRLGPTFDLAAEGRLR